MERLLATAGVGFLGSHLCERHVCEGADVLCVDNFYTRRRRNVGNPGEFTMSELAEQALRLTASRSRIVHASLPSDDPKRRRSDCVFRRT